MRTGMIFVLIAMTGGAVRSAVCNNRTVRLALFLECQNIFKCHWACIHFTHNLAANIFTEKNKNRLAPR